jgi:hypothetical protein
MRIRHYKVLKFIAIILFSFELLAPSMFASACKNDGEVEQHGKDILTPALGLGFSTFLLFEEIGEEEEREGRGDVAFSFADLYPSRFYGYPSNSLGVGLSLTNAKRMFDTHTPLFKLHRAFLI